MPKSVYDNDSTGLSKRTFIYNKVETVYKKSIRKLYDERYRPVWHHKDGDNQLLLL